MCRIPSVHIRIHVRLLGPCFKTGRKSATSEARQFTRTRGTTIPTGQLCQITRSKSPTHLRPQRSLSKTSTPVTWRQSPSPARKAFHARSPDIRSSWPSCFPFTSRLHPKRFQPLSHELSVHIILFQALFTLFSKFFWVFLHSTSSLSVFL